MVCAAVALVGAPALAASSPADPPSTASLVAHDAAGTQGGLFQDASQANPDDHTVEVTTGGTVTFSYPSGANYHNVKVATGSAQVPTNCNQTAGQAPLDQDGKLPMPAIVTGLPGPGWVGTCTFPTAGTYSLVCELHSLMTATVIVTDPTATA